MSTNAVARAICSSWWNRLSGWRHVEVTEQRTSAATTLGSCGFLVNEVYPHASSMRLVPRQSEHAHPCLPLRTLCAGVSIGVFYRVWSSITRAIHGRGREYGRDRDRHSPAQCSVSTSGKRGGAASSGECGRKRAQRTTAWHGLAVHAGARHAAFWSGSIRSKTVPRVDDRVRGPSLPSCSLCAQHVVKACSVESESVREGNNRVGSRCLALPGCCSQ
jgi:hypothetical protein